VRIIGGEWRGRRLQFPSTPALRPTPDRVRETVFNWLQFELAGRHCLDLFAGSGAFGLEALSRGAAAVEFVEADRVAAGAIEQSLHAFGATTGRVICEDAFAYLAGRTPRGFDLVFVDPPYAEKWLERACSRLESGGWLATGAWIYLEDVANRGAPTLPAAWTLLRSKKAGDVGYHLARRQAAS
jgi:16S rRNA (guanine966-N2)-methyltransferase